MVGKVYLDKKLVDQYNTNKIIKNGILDDNGAVQKYSIYLDIPFFYKQILFVPKLRSDWSCTIKISNLFILYSENNGVDTISICTDSKLETIVSVCNSPIYITSKKDLKLVIISLVELNNVDYDVIFDEMDIE